MSRPKGFHHSEETRYKIALTKLGEKNYNFGVPHSEEHKRRISFKLKG